MGGGLNTQVLNKTNTLVFKKISPTLIFAISLIHIHFIEHTFIEKRRRNSRNGLSTWHTYLYYNSLLPTAEISPHRLETPVMLQPLFVR